MKGWPRALTSLAAGAATVLAQAPFDLFWICLASFPILVWLLDASAAGPGAGPLRQLTPAFATGWWFGFGYFVAGLWWIGNALLVEADLFWWALPLSVVALPALLALFYGLACALARVFWSDGIGRVAALALGFGIAEWLRATVLTGFPWNAIGYVAMPVPLLMQSVALVGQTGMNALAVFVFAMPAVLADERPGWGGLAVAALLVAVHGAFGAARLAASDPAAAPSLAVRLVQPSIDQAEKWDTRVRQQIFQTYLDLSAGPARGDRPRAQLVIWPETALPFLLADRADALGALGDLLEDGQVLLAGAVRAQRDASGAPARFYNSIMAVNDKGEIFATADKVHLVPFGEYLPLERLLTQLGLRKIVDFPQSFSAGDRRRQITLPDGLRVLPLICYEVIFPGQIDAEAATADLIVNVTNDAWYGDTPGPYQHFRQAQLRAVESGLALVRAGNNGISAAVDAHGRIVGGLSLDAVGVADLDLSLDRTDILSPAGRRGGAGAIMLVLGLVAAYRRFARPGRRIDETGLAPHS